jgi:xylulokinase
VVAFGDQHGLEAAGTVALGAEDLELVQQQLEEGAAYGAALLAGVRAGVFADAADAVRRCVRVRETVEPEWDYEETYARFRSLYPTMKELR